MIAPAVPTDPVRVDREPGRAARCAFWLGFGLFLGDQVARASGWFARARRLLDDAHLDCVERGYLLVPLALERIGAGDIAGAYAASDEAAQIGARFADADLMALGGLGRGQALILRATYTRAWSCSTR